MVGNVRYDSLTEASEATGIKASRLCEALKKKKPLKDGRKVRYFCTKCEKPVEVLKDGKVVETYRSVSEFAKAMFVSESYAGLYLRGEARCPAIAEQIEKARFKR